MNETEQWKPVPGWEQYECSNLGQIRRAVESRIHPAGFVLSPKVDRHGYLKISLWRNGEVRHTQVHRIVAETWHGPCPSLRHQAAHNDGVRTNCKSSNIRWATAKENSADRAAHKIWNPANGSSHWKAKLNEKNVLEMKAMHLSGKKQTEIAQHFGVSKATVCEILKGKSWVHVL
jgi:hypothetical protein